MEEKIPENLLSSLFILRKCKMGSVRAFETFRKHKPKDLARERHFSYDMTFYLILEADNFLEEYRNHFTPSKVEPEYAKRVKEVKEILKPVKKQIDKWKDIHKFRNNIIAHGWRDQNTNYKLAVPDLNDYKVPRNEFGFQLLTHLITYMYDLIEGEFKTETHLASVHVANLYKGEPPKEDYSGINDELTKMAEDVYKLCKDRGKGYHLLVNLYQFTK